MQETEIQERIHFESVVSAFKYYRLHALQRLSKTEQYFKTLPEHHQKFMRNYLSHLNNVRHCIEANSAILNLIIQDVENMFVNFNPVEQADFTRVPVSKNMSDESDMEKIQAALKQLVRDWSEDGAEERECCYRPIIDEITTNYPLDKKSGKTVSVLVPGAGLGRLAFEIARRGYNCQGNEFSLYMLFASQFVLNKCKNVNMYQIYPWVHQYVNNVKAEHQTKSVSFPDVELIESMSGSDFTMAVGDFIEVYKEPDVWDCIATCFFIDCANNIAQFIETIYFILKPGGLWINLGPLLYHFSDVPNEKSIEPSYEVVREIILGLGFTFEKEETSVPTSYAQNPNSMLQYQYRSVFFSCRKPQHDISSNNTEN